MSKEKKYLEKCITNLFRFVCHERENTTYIELPDKQFSEIYIYQKIITYQYL